MRARPAIEVVGLLACVALARDATVALAAEVGLGTTGVFAIWGVALAILAVVVRGARPRVVPPGETRTLANVAVLVVVLVAVDALFSWALVHVLGGDVAVHLPRSWLSFATIAVLGPVVEEWLFRGVLWDAIAARANGVVAFALTSVLFGLSHCGYMLRPTWFAPSGTPVYLHVAFGACMGVLRWRYRAIGPGVAVHVLWNALYPLTS